VSLSFLLLRGLSPKEIFGLGRSRIPLLAGPPPANPLQRLFFSDDLPTEADKESESRPTEDSSAHQGAPATLLRDFLRGTVLFAAAYPLLMLIQLTSYALLTDQAESQDIVRFLVEQAT
jgi:hypothetical protein